MFAKKKNHLPHEKEMKLECADSDINSFFEEEKQRTSTLTKNKDGSLVTRVLPIRRKSSAADNPRHASSDGSNSVGKDEIALSPLNSPRGRSQSVAQIRRTPSPTVSTSTASFSAKSLSESRSSPAKKLSGNTSSEEEKGHANDSQNRKPEETEEEEEKKLEILREQLRSPRNHGSSDERNRQIDNLLTGVQGPHIPSLTKGPFTGLYSGSPPPPPPQQQSQPVIEEITPRRQSLSNLQSPAEKFINIDQRLKKLEQAINGHNARINNEIVRLRNLHIKEKENSIWCWCCDWIVSLIDSEDEGEEEYLENGLEKPFLSAFKEISS